MENEHPLTSIYHGTMVLTHCQLTTPMAGTTCETRSAAGSVDAGREGRELSRFAGNSMVPQLSNPHLRTKHQHWM